MNSNGLVGTLAVALLSMTVTASAWAQDPPVQGTFVLQSVVTPAGPFDLDGLMRANLPGYVALQVTWIFEGNEITSRTEVLLHSEESGYRTCSAAVTVEAGWTEGAIVLPGPVSAQGSVRRIVPDDANPGQWRDIDEDCRATLHGGTYNLSLDGDVLTLTNEEVVTTFNRGDPYLPYRDHLPQ